MLIPSRTLLPLPHSVLLTAIMASVFGVTTLFFQSQIYSPKDILLIIGCIAISLPFIQKTKINTIDTGAPVRGTRFTNFQKGSNMVFSILLPKYLLAKMYFESEETEKAKAAATEILNSPVKIKSTATNEIMNEMKNIVTQSVKEETQRGTEDFKDQPL